MSFIQKLNEIKFPSADAHVHIHTELFKYLLYLLICFSKNVSFKNCFHIVLNGINRSFHILHNLFTEIGV